MRSFSFRGNTAVIRTLKEPVIKKKKWNIDRVIYFILIAIVLFFVLRYVFNTLAVVQGNGQVLLEKVDVNFTQDIRINNIYIEEGDTICANQRLFTYQQNTFDNDGSLVINNQNKRLNAEQKLRELKLKLSEAKARLKASLKLGSNLNRQQEQYVRLVVLDVFTRDRLESLIKQISDNEVNTELLRQHIALLQQQLGGLKEEFNNFSIGTSGLSSYHDSYLSPISGIVGQIHKNESESCYRTENVLTIHNTDVVFIKAYFALEAVDEVQKNAIVKIKFPDNTISDGIINKVYISTYEAPIEFQKTYEPTERNIVAEIVPLDKADKALWTSFHMLNVEMEISRI
jgi:hypothetical protein